jgi:hypothetical protein
MTKKQSERRNRNNFYGISALFGLCLNEAAPILDVAVGRRLAHADKLKIENGKLKMKL